MTLSDVFLVFVYIWCGSVLCHQETQLQCHWLHTTQTFCLLPVVAALSGWRPETLHVNRPVATPFLRMRMLSGNNDWIEPAPPNLVCLVLSGKILALLCSLCDISG